MSQKREGWAYTKNAGREHYYANGRSLCGLWYYAGSQYYDALVFGPRGRCEEDCGRCWQALRSRGVSEEIVIDAEERNRRDAERARDAALRDARLEAEARYAVAAGPIVRLVATSEALYVYRGPS